MRMIDLYKRAEELGPEAVRYLIQYFIAGVDMVHEGFTDSKERFDFPHSDWCANQFGDAFSAMLNHVSENIEPTTSEAESETARTASDTLQVGVTIEDHSRLFCRYLDDLRNLVFNYDIRSRAGKSAE